MTERNRVMPTGTIERSPFRGQWMGNRGGPISQKPERRQWHSRAWIYCHLEFNNRQRVFREPGRRYTELFFYDEAHALAAGHRPCGECQHSRLRDFKIAAGFNVRTPVKEIDDQLHIERLAPRHETPLGSLADGTFVLIDGRPALVTGGAIRFWSADAGYTPRITTDATRPVTVLTPPMMMTALANGFGAATRISSI